MKVLFFLIQVAGMTAEMRVQKYLCRNCGASFVSKKQKKNIEFRNVIKTTIIKLILILRFGHGMSVRGIGDVIKNVYGIYDSVGYIDKICQKTGEMAKQKMDIINHCNQNSSKVLFFDETFPKSNEGGCVNLGVAVCENGLIRKVKTINTHQKSEDLKNFFMSLITKNYMPLFFISDYDQTYPKAIRNNLKHIMLLKDTVHTIRQIYRDSRSTINGVVVKFGATRLTKQKQKKVRDLKKKLLRKQLNKVLNKMLKGFKKEYCSVGSIYIEGGLEELRELSEKFQTLKPLYIKIRKFVKKHIKTWNDLMELHYTENIPLTSNMIESKNSIFKSFSKKAKCYSSEFIEKFFCAVALYENFSVKTRGKNKGTNAMTRAGIDLKQFGAENFFNAVVMSENIKTNLEINITF